MLRSMMHCEGRGIATGVAIACCTPTAGAGTPGTRRPANNDKSCEHVALLLLQNLNKYMGHLVCYCSIKKPACFLDQCLCLRSTKLFTLQLV